MIPGILPLVFVLSPAVSSPAIQFNDKCDDLYYGIGVSRDLPKAYACYATEGVYLMQILMVLNGEGVPQDPDRAEALFAAWSKADAYAANNFEGADLRKALLSLRSSPANFKPIDFCRDMANNTISGNLCASLDARRAEVRMNSDLDRIAGSLDINQKQVFAKLREAFAAYQSAEGGRGFQSFIRGTIRNQAGALQEAYVREHFLAGVKAIVEERTLAAVTELELRAAESDMNQAYKENLKAGVEDEKDGIGIGDGYEKTASESQRAWTAYRDAWVALVSPLSGGKLGNATDAARNIRARLARDRIDELQHNILGTH